MMYGGTAKTYSTYEFNGNPFLENGSYYINVIHPKTGAEKKVRWYTDKKHADLMPKSLFTSKKPMWELFGFKSKDDSIWCIQWKYLSDEESKEYFHFKWRGGNFFGGSWYAPKDTELPDIKNKDKFFLATWREFKVEGQKNSRELGIVNEKQSDWFKED